MVGRGTRLLLLSTVAALLAFGRADEGWDDYDDYEDVDDEYEELDMHEQGSYDSPGHSDKQGSCGGGGNNEADASLSVLLRTFDECRDEEFPPPGKSSSHTCGDCLVAIVNNNPLNFEQACTECVFDHHFDCHCSCASFPDLAGTKPEEVHDGSPVPTGCVELPRPGGNTDTCKDCVSAIMNGNPSNKERACNECVGEHSFDCHCTCDGVIPETGAKYRPGGETCIEVAKPEHNGDTCTDCLTAIMNGNPNNRQQACRECGGEHGFDCHCSCADREAKVVGGGDAGDDWVGAVAIGGGSLCIVATLVPAAKMALEKTKTKSRSSQEAGRQDAKKAKQGKKER